ncbi:hypothetical protein EIP86_001930 [Pleurotus ostreatoroseus]|nr:hypothetical protein EIP86_001930 [Pleurotus ostreatoroseus]
MPLPVPKAELIGTCLEMIGAYLVVFIDCVKVLYKKYTRGRSASYLWIVALAIFLLCTLHLIVDIVRIMAAFTGHMNVPNAPATYYGNVNSPLDVTKTAVYCTVTLISDALIVYRLFAVWNQNYYVAVIPAMAFIADIGTSAWFTWSLHQVKPGDDVLVANVTVRAKYFYSVTLILNVICTFGISYKIWIIQRGVSGYAVSSATRLRRIITVIVESAAIYSAWLIALIITSEVGESALFILLNSISPIIGMVFSAVIIRVSIDRNNYSTMSHVSGSRFGFSKGSDGRSNPITRQTAGSGNAPVVNSRARSGGVQITLDTVTHKDPTSEYEMDKIETTDSTSFTRDKVEDLA